MKHLKSHCRILGLAMCFSLFATTAAWAKFNPRNPTLPIGPMTTGGPRGCAAGSPLAFTALVPVNIIAEITADQAVVAWYSPDRDPYRVTLKLYEAVPPGTAQTRWKLVKQVAEFENKAGMKFYRLPAELLQPGKVYTWQAVLECVPGYPSGDAIAEAEVQVIAKPHEPKENARSIEYSLWYSALAEAEHSKELQLKLLRDLITYEELHSPHSPAPKQGLKRSEMLKKILETLSR
ncbi:MAG: DUF928 domain-containing protein [Leptolyngbya sp. UWPOB_LEPTO1]|uniref:DUF928 domain-containing protein n=1 Tax=Leptolyngbya sp. UWPOB_LEPTO1 TaxID=2815653 RepID=UPI001AD33BEE|nr:DUF928 domain-containing protein [Leptolyngbya sp. UWPOB_LEPTO1]MBN8564960.1 DUF928 domain-containing protein [Leptolyngbya sp. UWPOB_LEPTO1]